MNKRGNESNSQSSRSAKGTKIGCSASSKPRKRTTETFCTGTRLGRSRRSKASKSKRLFFASLNNSVRNESPPNGQTGCTGGAAAHKAHPRHGCLVSSRVDSGQPRSSYIQRVVLCFQS